LKAIIMAGGSGARLWPLSRGKYPKQFIKLKGQALSLFQMSVERALRLGDIADIYVLTVREYEFIVKLQVDELGHPSGAINILIEPQPKNTLPAIYNAALAIRESSGDDTVVALTSDHLMSDTDDLFAKISAGARIADQRLFAFGIKPTAPDTGFGYIRPGEALSAGYEVAEFKEKPDLATAQKYVASGYYWNSGMFMFHTALLTQEVRAHAPEVYEAFQAPTPEERFAKTPNISIDYGVLEKTAHAGVLPLDIKWDDLGSFAAFYETYAGKAGARGNISMTEPQNDILIDATNNLIYPQSDKVYALVGVDNLVVVDQGDALLITDKPHSQDVRKVVEELKSRGDQRADYHQTEFRPWGSFTVLENGRFHKIKRLTVLPGKQLSYQMHYHRSEHWVVVSGAATVVMDGVSEMVRSNESVYINAGTRHRLRNDGKMPLEVIEVQSGQYLGEDDITRFEDDFGRIVESGGERGS
jgi:mannose-1-phosphate guanylyltransferase/mannose-6-phosphate isomerase